MKSFTLNFSGYWRESKKEHIPGFTGIYLVYRCVYNPSSDTVTLRELVYIGQSDDVNERILQHSQNRDFQRVLFLGEELCYSVSEVQKKDLDLVENALIYAQQPKLNNQGKDSFRYQDCSFNLVGRCALLKFTSFSITNP